MLCVRCSHPLPSGADRCLRCFALNPQNRGATPPPELKPRREKPAPAPEPSEPPSFFQPPVTDPELAAIGLSDPPAAPLRLSIESDPPPPTLSAGFSIESEPPRPSLASISSDPPAPADGPFELAPPASSPRLAKAAKKPQAARQQPLPLKPAAPRAPAPEEEPPPTLIFGAPEGPALPEQDELGDIDLDKLDHSGPQRVPPEPHAAATEPPAPTARAPLQLEEGWRLASSPPPHESAPPALSAPPPAAAPHAQRDLLAAELDLSAPGAPLSNSLLATPLDVESLSAPNLGLETPPPTPARPSVRGPWAPPGARLASWAVDALILLVCAALLAVVAVQVVGTERLAPAGFGSADYWLDLVVFGPRLPLLWAALLATLALAYSWLFGWAGGRTPGMALAGLRLVPLLGARLTPGRALARAALSVLSAAAGLSGFLLALFDARGQALHDKLTGTAVVRDGIPLELPGRP